ncbi:MAG: hypothetical protein M1828_001112 [Chrysothrix sp. TS-e1954]|nr:MAG: hypothetical protein M1828_001112 [Chrysothrix sp. TS-e1954]
MASTSSEPAGTAATPSQASDPTPIPQPSTSTTQYTPSGIPIEMNSLPSEFASRPSQPERFDTAAEDLPVLDGSTVSRQANDEGRDDGDAAAAPTSSTPRDELQTVSEPPSSSKASAPKPSNIDTAIASSTPTIKRMQTNPETPAIALAPETPIVSVNPSEGSVVLVTLMLTTGSRYSFRIDPKYLKRRNIGAQDEDKDPWEISVYTMKELLWRDWRDGQCLLGSGERLES